MKLLLLTLSLLSLAVHAASPVLNITLYYGSAANGYPPTFVGQFIRLRPGNVAQGYSGEVVATVAPGSIVTMQKMDTANPRTASDLINDFKGRIASTVNQTAASMVTEMQTQNSASGSFEYRQAVLLPNSQKGELAWRLLVDSSGAVRYGDPEIVPEEPLTLDAVYTPLALSSVLPASWPKYSEAGVLKWRLIDRNGLARTAWTALNTGGAYDNPESNGGGGIDPDAGLKCLILDRTRCGGPTDIKTLMEQQGVQMAYVAYTRRLIPVYDNVPDPAQPGQYLQQARISLSVDERTLAYNGCGNNVSYRNRGRYGYTLAASSEKYLVDAQLRYYAVDWADESRISPTESYDKSVNLAWSDAARAPGWLITPGVTAADGIIAVSDVSGIVYLAPVTQGARPVVERTFSPPLGGNGLPIIAAQGYQPNAACAFLLPGSTAVSWSCVNGPERYPLIFTLPQQCDWGPSCNLDPYQLWCDTPYGGAWYPAGGMNCVMHRPGAWCYWGLVESLTCRQEC